VRTLERALQTMADEQRRGMQALQAQVAELLRAAHASGEPGHPELHAVRKSLMGLSRHIAEREDPLFAAGRLRLMRMLEQITQDKRQILIGPWTGEVGFELLYWIPFIRWVRAQFDVGPEREIVVSRGGVDSWYGVGADRYSDVFSLLSADDFRTSTTAKSTLKQPDIDDADRRIIDDVTRQRGLDAVNVLHPSLMYKAFRQFWDDDAGYGRIQEFTKYALLTPPAAERPEGLPDEYVAVRFYFRRSFADNRDNRMFAHAVVSALAQRVPVVLLTSGARVDDHSDWIAKGERNVIVAASGAVERNLAVQSAIIAGARAFVGTYGGYSYLAPLYGVPTIAFYARRRFEWKHLYAAERAFERIGAAPLTAIHVSQAPLVQSALAAVMGAAS
jgi:hypothetical protein